MPTQRFCQALELQDDSRLIAEYRKAHSREHFWKEIGEGIRAVGILEMEIYIAGNKLVMVAEAPAGFDWDGAMARLATLPRQAEWEDFVAAFQRCRPGASSGEKWQPMERIFHLY